MEYELDDMMNFDELGLYYEVHMAGIDGENFIYSVYFENGAGDDDCDRIEKAIEEFVEPYGSKDIYLGYISVSKASDRAIVYLDVGNVEPGDSQTAINGILKAINNVDGISKVIINED